MGQRAINFLFGVLFNLAAGGLIVGLMALGGAARGEIEIIWIARIGVILEILGIALLALDYAGVIKNGQSPLRWWLRKAFQQEDKSPMPPLWPGQIVIIIGAGALVFGLVLQLISSWEWRLS